MSSSPIQMAPEWQQLQSFRGLGQSLGMLQELKSQHDLLLRMSREFLHVPSNENHASFRSDTQCSFPIQETVETQPMQDLRHQLLWEMNHFAYLNQMQVEQQARLGRLFTEQQQHKTALIREYYPHIYGSAPHLGAGSSHGVPPTPSMFDVPSTFSAQYIPSTQRRPATPLVLRPETEHEDLPELSDSSQRSPPTHILSPDDFIEDTHEDDTKSSGTSSCSTSSCSTSSCSTSSCSTSSCRQSDPLAYLSALAVSSLKTIPTGPTQQLIAPPRVPSPSIASPEVKPSPIIHAAQPEQKSPIRNNSSPSQTPNIDSPTSMSCFVLPPTAKDRSPKRPYSLGGKEQAHSRPAKKSMGEKPFPCPDSGCAKTFPDINTLKRHYRVHTGERPFKCQFAGCVRAFRDASNFRRHELTHSGEKPYKCPVTPCERCFSRGSSLKKHMISVHKLAPDHPSILVAIRKSAGSRRRQQAIKKLEPITPSRSSAISSSQLLDFLCHQSQLPSQMVPQLNLFNSPHELSSSI